MRWVYDAGHGWLEVSLLEYPEAEQHGTGFGYVDLDNGTIYLEEDCEAPSFLRATFGDSWVDTARGITECHYDDAPCRELPRNLSMMSV